MASKRQKKKQRKQKENQRLQSKQLTLNVEESIDQAKDELKQFEEEMKDEIIVTENSEKDIEEIKTEEDFSNKLDNILSQNTEDKKEEEKKKANSTAEKIAEEYKDTEKFTMKDITKMMRSSGLSYRQIMQQMKAIGKATEEYAATQGDDFDRKEFLRKQMEQRLGKK